MLIKNYEDIISYIFDFELVRDYRLKRVQYCADILWNPQDNYKVIHITGTNGKWSTCTMCFSVLKGRWKKVGIFTSPHLFDIRERFRTQDGMISQEDLITIVNKIIALNIELSYFEKCTLIAFEYFRQQWCEYAVIEVGVGGLLDSTNIVKPTITAITSLWYDHIDILWPTLDDIAFQKAGIIKSWVPVVLNFHNEVIEQQAHKIHSPIIFTDKHISTNLVGAHQTQNAALAYEITHYLGAPDEIINKWLQQVSHPGRLEYIAPNLLIDGAHNEQWLEALKIYIDTIKQDYSQIIYCFSLKKWKEDKIQEYIIERFWKEQEYIIVDHYHNLLAQHNNIIKEIKNIEYSIKTPHQIKQLAEHNKNILYVVFWSLYMIGWFYQ
jgi:dihydrofolate synthase/folylpolyglutamate synthase